MSYAYPQPVAVVPRFPIYAMLAAFPMVCFTLTLATDIAYWLSGGNLLWQNFSAWLLFVGLVFGGLALLVGIVGLILRRHRVGWPAAVGKIVVLLLAFANSFVHAGDGWTAVVPYGLILSAVTLIVMIVAAVLDRPVYR